MNNDRVKNVVSMNSEDEEMLFEAQFLAYRRRHVSDDDNKNINAANALLARAGLRGVLKVMPGGDDSLLSRCLLESITLSVDQNFHNDDVRTWISCETCTSTTNNENSFCLRSLSNPRNKSNKIDADAFFEEYPECCCNNESEEEESVIEDNHSAAKKDSPTSAVDLPSLPQNRVHQANLHSRSDNTCSSDGSDTQEISSLIPTSSGKPQSTAYSDVNVNHQLQMQAPTNPYNIPRKPFPSVAQVQGNPYDLFFTNETKFCNNNHNQQHHHAHATRSWEDHHRQQNPFQTAREYAMANKNSNARATNVQHFCQHNGHDSVPRTVLDPSENLQTIPPPPQPMIPASSNPYGNNPYHHRSDPEPSSSPFPPAPVIRDSLKRKFQPPKLGATVTTTTTRRAISSSISSNTITGRNQKNTTAPNSEKDGNNTENDDLPEELKKYGKDLVEKIENEIMENGDSISFQDIAGLADQKQTVMEVVCWPMKRPDLFTGLRRAPNGLLLFGPPGTGKTLIGKVRALLPKTKNLQRISFTGLKCNYLGYSPRVGSYLLFDIKLFAY
jgi:hypothetical protein